MRSPIALTGTAVLAIAGVGVAGWLAWRASKAAGEVAGAAVQGAKDAAWAVTPWNNDNIIARADNAVVSAATGRDETLGGWFYSVTHPDPMAQMDRAAAAAKSTVTDNNNSTVTIDGVTFNFGP